MPDKSTVDPEAMRTAAGHVQHAVEVINGLENQIDSHLTNLLSGWTGEAATRFAGVLNEWLIDFRDIRAQLQTMVDKLHGTRQAYQNTEQEEREGINRLSALLNKAR